MTQANGLHPAGTFERWANDPWGSVRPRYRIEMVHMPNDPDPIPTGTRGTVTDVVRSGTEIIQLWIEWDTDRSLCLVPGDEFRILTVAECNDEDRAARAAAEFELERDRIRDTKEFFRHKPTREEKATSLGWSNYP